MQNKRKVLITGANRGLGLKLAEVLAEKYELILTARSIESLEKVKENLEQQFQNLKILIHQLDISNQESILQLKEWLIKKNITIDVLVNNAGVAKDAKDIIDINVLGTINVSEVLLPQLSQDGKIILVSSMLGKLERQSPILQKQLSYPKTRDQIIQISMEHRSQPNQNLHQYSSSKALLNAYGRYILSSLVLPNQSVYCMHPGWIKTDMGGSNAPGELDDGVVTSKYLIDVLPFGRDEQYHGKYFNDIAKVEEY